MATKHVLAVLGAAIVASAAVFASSAASKTSRTTADDPNNANLTYWYWAESDAPGANDWLKKEVAIYEKAHPKVKITVVIQSTDTLTSAFTTASQTKSGPDIATQWATLPTLTPAWNGSTVPISDYVPASETKNWIGTAENMWQRQAVGDAAVPARHPLRLEQDAVQEGGPQSEQGPEDLGGLPRRREEAEGSGHHAVRHGQQGRLRRRLVLLADRQAEPQLDRRAQGRDDRQGEVRRPEVLGLLPGARRSQEETAISTPTSPRSASSRASSSSARRRSACRGAPTATSPPGRSSSARRTWASAPIPIWGHGKLATSYDTTQSSDAFITKWSKHPRAAAQFLVFLHSPQALKAWYAATGVFPADKRFPASLVTDPIAKQLLALDQSPVSVWPENFVPPQVDGNADLAGGELITSGSASPATRREALGDAALEVEEPASGRVP